MTLRWLVGACCALIATLPVCGSAQTVYEGFNQYSTSAEILSTNGGTGFTDGWQPRSSVIPGGGGSGVPSPNSVQLLPSSLTYTDAANNALQTAGGSLQLTGEFGSVHVARTYDHSALPHPHDPVANPQVIPTTGATTYVSFLGRRSGAAADPNDPIYGGNYPWGDNLFPRVAGVNFWSNDNGDGVPMHVGNLSNQQHDVWQLRGQDLDDQNPPPRTDQPFGEGAQTYLLVMKFEHGTGDGQGDQVTLYMNPLLSLESLNTPNLVENWEHDDDPLHLPGSWLSVEAGDSSGNRPFSIFTLDEFRVGNTWAAVTPFSPIPEPNTVALCALLLGAAGLKRRR